MFKYLLPVALLCASVPAMAQYTVTSGDFTAPGGSTTPNRFMDVSRTFAGTDSTGNDIYHVSVVQTGLESLTVYSNGGSDPVATYSNVSFTISPFSVTASGPATYTGSGSTLKLSSPGHDNLLTLSWDTTTNIHNTDRGANNNIYNASGNFVASGELSASYGDVSGLSFGKYFVPGGNQAQTYTDLKITTNGQATPEPVSLVGLGVAGVGLWLKKRRKA